MKGLFTDLEVITLYTGVMNFVTKTFLSIGLLALSLAGVSGLSHAQPAASQTNIVYVAPIKGVIDLGLAPFVERVLAEAEKNQAAAVVLDINTFGGRVDAAVQIRDALLNSPVRTIAFVDKRAISAGALISLAAQTIVMAPGGTIGAATPVQSGPSGTTATVTSEKTVSYVRKEFRATAESRKRPPLVAEAMVDSDVVIPDVSEKGKLLTLTTEEALKLKVADFQANSIDALLKELNINDAELRTFSPNWAEEVVRFLTHPVVSSLLVSVAMLGIFLELRTPGFGIPGIIGLSSLSLFMWGHWLVQLAGWEELLLALIGIFLFALELFVIPGFGVVGILGLLALLGALVLSTLGAGSHSGFVLWAVARMGFSLVVAVVLSAIFLKFLPKLPVGRKLVLNTELEAASGYSSAPPSDYEWLGQTGIAHSPLRPAGIADFQGHRLDVVSDGEFIDAGAPIRVLHVDGNRIVVQRDLGPHT
jgi:membrane-bound serine protease (ClpP class)